MSDSRGGRLQRGGLDVPAALAHKQERGTLVGLANAEAVTNEELVELPCDILAPCALEQVVTEENADRVRRGSSARARTARSTPAADAILEDKGVLVLPDVLANAGGVVVSYFEWVQGLQEYFWREDEVNAKLHDIVVRAFEETWQTRERPRHEPAHGLLRARRAARRRGDDDAGASTRSARVTVYTRAGCSLCERALEVVTRPRPRSASSSRSSTSPATPSSRRATASSCPVVEIDGERAFTYFVDARRASGAARSR